MSVDVTTLRTFYYDKPLGRVTRRILSDDFARHWPVTRGCRLLGIGYATPFLRRTLHDVERTLAFMPATQGVHAWPPEGPSVSSLVLEDTLPLPDSSVDRVLAVHAIENADRPDEVLHEIWRVLAPEGRLLLVVPNRRGFWARADGTPFGAGRPYSREQLHGLLKQAHFMDETWSSALIMPPFQRPSFVRAAPTFERLGHRGWTAFAGVLIVDALKRQRQGPPRVRESRFARALVPVLAPPIPAPQRLTRTIELPQFSRND